MGERNYAETGIVRRDDIVEQLEWHGICVRNAAGLCLLQQSLYEIERLRAEVIAIRAERDCAQIQAAHLARRLVTEARLHGGPP